MSGINNFSQKIAHFVSGLYGQIMVNMVTCFSWGGSVFSSGAVIYGTIFRYLELISIVLGK